MSGAAEHGRGVFRSAGLLHAARNAGWMLSGRVFQALLSLLYLAVAARTLGPRDFGQFALILTTGQAIVSLVSFQNWQTIVHFGMEDLRTGSRDRLKRLTGFCIFLDGLSFVAGALVACLGIRALLPWLQWSDRTADLAFAFAIVMLASLSSTPIGLLRLLDRFGAAAGAEAVTPIVRAGGALAAAWFGGGVTSFLLAWAAAELGAAIAYWTLAHRSGLIELGGLRRSALAQAVAEHPGLWRFALLSNAGATLGYARRPAVQLLVGGLAGPASAGSFRIGLQLSSAISRLSLILSRAIYPEFVRDRHVDRDNSDIIHRALRLALFGGLILIIVCAAAGAWMIELLFGPAYRNAYPLFLLLSAAAAADLIGAVLEPALVARGHPGRLLWAKLAAAALLFVTAYLLFTKTEMGVIGIAWAALLTSLASAGGFWLMLRERR